MCQNCQTIANCYHYDFLLCSFFSSRDVNIYVNADNFLLALSINHASSDFAKAIKNKYVVFVGLFVVVNFLFRLFRIPNYFPFADLCFLLQRCQFSIYSIRNFFQRTNL